MRRKDIDLEVRESRSSGHLLELAFQAREQRPHMVVSAGGDGTHHFVINGLYGSQTPLGFLPLGSGNDLTNGLGIPAEPGAAGAALLNSQIREIDLARVGSVVYACVAGVGFDALVTRFANEHAGWLSGPAAYAWAILRCLKFYRPVPLQIVADGQNFSVDVLLAAVGNNVSYGGGLKVTPLAKLDDGWLDVCVVPDLGKLELLRWVPRAYRGQHLAHPRILYFQARKIALRASSRLDLFADGEFIQELPAMIEAVPRALRVMVPGRHTSPAADAAGMTSGGEQLRNLAGES